MKKAYLPLMVLGILLMSPTPVNAADYGKTWVGLPKPTQVWYVAGFIEGYLYGHLDSKPWLSLPPPSEKKPKEVNKDKVIRILSLEYEVIADTMTRFYRDPANHGIEHSFICNVALNKLIGGTMEEAQRELEEIRRMLKSPPKSDQ
jgi:hypothetical protein